MRDIKFRAWDVEGDEFITDYSDGEFSLVEFYGDGFEVIQSVLVYALINGEHEQYESFERISENVELMQFTGLKDKDRKDIYEGDILSRNNMKTGYVAFETGSFRIMIDTPKGMRNYVLGSDGADLSQIIGNIYENPELLEAK